MPLSDGLEPADETLVVIAWYDGDRLVALGDNDNGEPNLYLYGDPEVRELVEAATEAYGPTARAIPVKEFRKLAGEEALEEFPLLARHRGTPDYEPLLFLAETLIDGYMADEIDMDLEEMPDDPDELTGWLEHMNRAGWMEDEHGHAVHVTPMYVRYEDEGELPPSARPGILHRLGCRAFRCQTVIGSPFPGCRGPWDGLSCRPCKVLTIFLQDGTVEVQAPAMAVAGGRHGSTVHRQGPGLAQQRVPHRVG